MCVNSWMSSADLLKPDYDQKQSSRSDTQPNGKSYYTLVDPVRSKSDLESKMYWWLAGNNRSMQQIKIPEDWTMDIE